MEVYMECFVLFRHSVYMMESDYTIGMPRSTRPAEAIYRLSDISLILKPIYLASHINSLAIFIWNLEKADISLNRVISPNRYIGLHIKGGFLIQEREICATKIP